MAPPTPAPDRCCRLCPSALMAESRHRIRRGAGRHSPSIDSDLHASESHPATGQSGGTPAGQNRSIETQLHRAQKSPQRPLPARSRTLGAGEQSSSSLHSVALRHAVGHSLFGPLTVLIGDESSGTEATLPDSRDGIELVDPHALRSCDARRSTDSDERSRSLDATNAGRYIHCAWPRHGPTSGPLAIQQARRVGGGRWDLCGEMGFWP